MSKILVVDDEKNIREIIADYMTNQGLEVIVAENGEDAVDKCYEQEFDFILMDVMMPLMSGIEACEEIRKESDVPVVFLSALGEDDDLLAAYNVGADDYVVKPFSLPILYRKIKTVIARYRGISSDNCMSCSGIVVDLSSMQVAIDGKPVDISGKDYQLLVALMQNKGIVLSRDQLLSKIWGYDFEGDPRVLDTRVRRLRRLMGDKADCIRTKVNVGYLFEEKEDV